MNVYGIFTYMNGGFLMGFHVGKYMPIPWDASWEGFFFHHITTVQRGSEEQNGCVMLVVVLPQDSGSVPGNLHFPLLLGRDQPFLRYTINILRYYPCLQKSASSFILNIFKSINIQMINATIHIYTYLEPK